MSKGLSKDSIFCERNEFFCWRFLLGRKSKSLSFTFALIFLGSLIGCSSSRIQTATLIDSASIPNRIAVGMKRPEVENLLGKPYSVQEIISRDFKYQGVEVRVMYSPQLRSMERQVASDMQENQDIALTGAILSGSLSVAGYAAPGTGIATGVASSGVGVVQDMASTKLDRALFNPSLIYSALVVYRNNRVYSIERRTLSSGPR